MAGDQRQRIFDDYGGLAKARELVGEDATVELPLHYRIGPAICEVADKIRVDDGPPLADTENYQDTQFPARVDCHRKDSLEAQCELLVTNIATQLRSYPDEWIGIIVLRNEELDIADAFLRESEIADKVSVFKRGNRDRNFDVERPICLMTLHSSKGTEFRAVHWLGACQFPYFSKEKAFTLITRAKSALDVYHTNDLKPELASAIVKRTPPTIGLPE